MEATKKRPAPRGQRVTGRKQRFFYNRRTHGNTKPAEISTLLAKKIFHDLNLVMERKPVSLSHLRGGPT